MLQYFGDEDGRDRIHATVRSLRADRQSGSPLGQMENTTTILYRCPWNYCRQSQTSFATSPCRAGCSRDIFATLSDTGTTYTEALTALNTHFSPQKSLQFEIHTFRQAHQAPNESIAQYVTRLRRLGEHCDFDKYSLEKAIKDQLIEHCHSTTLRRRLLREKSTASLSSLLDIAHSVESANFQTANIENASSQERQGNAHQLTMPTISEEEQVNFTSEKRQQCTHYGNQRDHQPKTPRCPAFRKTCSQCGILHHF